jgi:hypothetical protein
VWCLLLQCSFLPVAVAAATGPFVVLSRMSRKELKFSVGDARRAFASRLIATKYLVVLDRLLPVTVYKTVADLSTSGPNSIE